MVDARRCSVCFDIKDEVTIVNGHLMQADVMKKPEAAARTARRADSPNTLLFASSSLRAADFRKNVSHNIQVPIKCSQPSTGSFEKQAPGAATARCPSDAPRLSARAPCRSSWAARSGLPDESRPEAAP